jgi:mRNA interferase MazF
LVAFPHTGGAQGPTRPALVILDAGDADVVLARVTTRAPTTPYDVKVVDWQSAGLLAPSTVRLHKLASLEKRLVQRRVGSLEPADRAQVSSVMRQTYGNW